jgi:hypothetical protein
VTAIDAQVEAILAARTYGDDAIAHTVRATADAQFTFDYERSRPALHRLAEKAKTSQWNGSTDLAWDTDVDPAKVAAEISGGDMRGRFIKRLTEADGSPVRSWGDREWNQYTVEVLTHRLSQFLHGEQGALICTAKIVETVPWIDAKHYAASQVIDEARHVEVFGRYLDEKMHGKYPVNPHLQSLLDDIIADTRWDMTYLGMQIIVEGLALAAFGFMHAITTEPLCKQLLRYVMSDEARHVAFGVISLQELYKGFDAKEIRERQEFAYEASVRMRDRFLMQEVWERLGVDPRAILRVLLSQPREENRFQGMLFSKIVPNVKKLGLLDAGDGWLRQKYTEMGVIQFEDWVDTSTEYEQLDLTRAG